MKKEMPPNRATTGEVRMSDFDEQFADPLSEAWRGLYREAPIGLCHFDTRLRYVHINDWLAALNGMSVAQHPGRTVGDGAAECQVAVATRRVDRRLEVSISDSGVGISPQAMARVFESLYSSKSFGVGLGVAVGQAGHGAAWRRRRNHQ